MKIVIVLPSYYNTPIGGYHVQYQYANLLSHRGHDVTILFPHQLESGHPVKSRVKTPLWALRLRLQNRPLIGSFPLDARVKVRLMRDLSGHSLPSADVLVATAWQTAEAMADAPTRCGRKFYVVYDYEHLMTAGPDIRERIEATYRMPFSMVATSKIVADTIRRCGGEPVANVPCGLDFDAFGVDVPPKQRKRLTVGFPARKEAFKGAADAVAAATLLRAQYNGRFRCAAFGSVKMDLPDWIEWHQYPSQAELRHFYNAQSVFMVPSHFEGWGLPGAEALACGAALVTTDNGGCRDYALDGQTALVVPPNEPAGLAAAVTRLFENDNLRQQLAQAGNEFVQRYTWAGAADGLERLIGQSV